MTFLCLAITFVVACYGLPAIKTPMSEIRTPLITLHTDNGDTSTLIKDHDPNAWFAQHDEALRGVKTLEKALEILNGRILDFPTILKIKEIHQNYTSKHNPVFLRKSAELFKHIISKFDLRNILQKNRFARFNLFTIFEHFVSDDLRLFKSLTNAYLNSCKVKDPLNPKKISMIKQLYFTILSYEKMIQSVPGRTKLRQISSETQLIAYQHQFIIEYEMHLYKSSWELYCYPSFEINVNQIKYFPRFAARKMQPLWKDITLRLRARYIIHFLRMLPIEIRQSVTLQKELGIYRKLEEIRDQLMEKLEMKHLYSAIDKLINECAFMRLDSSILDSSYLGSCMVERSLSFSPTKNG